jgi:hypothetical protein
VVELSIIPDFNGKITAKNCKKQFVTELRSIPALVLSIGLTKAYPS